MTQDKTPLEELKDALRGRGYGPSPRDSKRARVIKGIWRMERDKLTDAQFEQATPPHAGPVLAYPDPDSPSDDLIYSKIIYDGGTVIECEGVVVCRLA